MNLAHSLAIQNIAVGIIAQVIGVYIFLKSPKKHLNRIFLLFCLIFSIWLYGFFFLLTAKDLNSALFWSKIIYLGVCFSSVISYHFVRVFLGITSKKWVLILFYFLSIISLFATVFTNKLLDGVYHYNWGYYPKAGKYHYIFLSYIIIETGYTLFLLYKRLKMRNSCTVVECARVKYVFWGFAIGHLALENFIAMSGIPIVPLAQIFILTLFILIGYSVIYHQLFSVKIVLKRTIIYSLLISIITIGYFIIIFLSERFFSTFIGYHSMPLAVLMIIFFSLIFTPLKNRLQIIIDRVFFQGSIDQINQENLKLRGELQKTEKMKAVATLAAGMAHEIK